MQSGFGAAPFKVKLVIMLLHSWIKRSVSSNPALDLEANLHRLFQQAHITVVSSLSTLDREPPTTDVCGASSVVFSVALAVVTAALHRLC